jgi:RNA polymerase sigma-70 factor, ECF subfamily
MSSLQLLVESTRGGSGSGRLSLPPGVDVGSAQANERTLDRATGLVDREYDCAFLDAQALHRGSRGLSSAVVDPLTRLAICAAGGDTEALDALVRATYADVWRLCATLVDRQGADDLAQETFIRAMRGLSRFRGDSSARTWLIAVARHTCMDDIRARDRRRRRDASRTALGQDREPVGSDVSETSTVDDLLGRLEPDRRAAFFLTQYLDFSYGEAAAVCECPVGTIRSRVARARADLLALLTAEATDDERTERHRRPTA